MEYVTSLTKQGRGGRGLQIIYRQKAPIASAKEHRPCAFCQKASSKYVCPTCQQPYCNLQCYKSTAHQLCSEAFYQQEVMAAVGAPLASAATAAQNSSSSSSKHLSDTTAGPPAPIQTLTEREEKEDRAKQMQAILLRQYQALCMANDEDNSEEAINEEETFRGVHLPSASAQSLFAALTPDERDRFHALLRQQDERLFHAEGLSDDSSSDSNSNSSNSDAEDGERRLPKAKEETLWYLLEDGQPSHYRDEKVKTMTVSAFRHVRPKRGLVSPLLPLCLLDLLLTYIVRLRCKRPLSIAQYRSLSPALSGTTPLELPVLLDTIYRSHPLIQAQNVHLLVLDAQHILAHRRKLKYALADLERCLQKDLAHLSVTPNMASKGGDDDDENGAEADEDAFTEDRREALLDYLSNWLERHFAQTTSP